ncbi:hypothetical protein C809_04206 [Lachnospiraceae bacterium MD335]|nr:hypothetical protein C809_04206 [Lachnospiraceae bacterium MD335]
MDGKYDKYLEGNYDAANEERQERTDKLQAERIGRLAGKMQIEQTEDLINSVLGDEELPVGDEEAVRELLHEYVSNKDEYLVDGAALTCNMAATGTYMIRNVAFGTEIKNMENPTRTYLRVSANLTEINGKPVATIKDHKKIEEEPESEQGNAKGNKSKESDTKGNELKKEKNGNIEPFKCNCLNFPDRESEYERIFKDKDCRKYGTCRQLMNLESDWENFIKSTGYLSFSRTTEKERAQGITMKSVLFCSHGGLITPVTSGQIRHYAYGDIIDKVTLERIKLLHPMIQQQTIDFIVSLQEVYPDIRIVQGLRTIEEQDALYNQGRNGNSGKKVTDAKGGSSYHNFGLAIDIGRITNNQLSYDIDWQKVEEIGNEYGFEWGGNWTSIIDKPHFQITFGYTTKELLQLYKEGKVKNGYVQIE